MIDSFLCYIQTNQYKKIDAEKTTCKHCLVKKEDKSKTKTSYSVDVFKSSTKYNQQLFNL